MANTKISGLPAATAIGGTDVFPIVQGGVTKQATITLLLPTYFPTFTEARATPGTYNGETRYIQGGASEGDGREGMFRWVSGATVTDDNGVVLAATGGRWHRIFEIVSLKYFGWKGDGTNCDTAFTDAFGFFTERAKGGLLWIPAGSGTKAQSHTVPIGVCMSGEGYRVDAGTHLIAAGYSGPMFNFGSFEPFSSIERISFISTAGDIIDWEESTNASVRNCRFNAAAASWGIVAGANTFGNLVDTCYFAGNGAESNNGLHAPGHTVVLNCEFAGLDVGLSTQGLGVSVVGGRIEVCQVGCRVGFDETGADEQSQPFNMTGTTFETNVLGLQVKAIGASFEDVIVTSNNSDGEIGVLVEGLTRGQFRNFAASGQYTDCAFRVLSASNTDFSGVNVSNSGDGIAWDFAKPLANNNRFSGCNYPFHEDDTLLTAVTSDVVRTTSIVALNALVPAVAGKNLNAINVPVTETATTKAVLFSSEVAGGTADIDTIAAATTGGATLADATYYYRCCGVTPLGEILGGAEETVTVSGADNSVNIAMYGGHSGRFKFRIYRGTATGVYDGYFEMDELDTTFSDIGQAFTREGSLPPPVGGSNTMAEPDANYGVWVSPSWLTTWRVTSKATTGFTVDFGTAAPASATIDWLITR